MEGITTETDELAKVVVDLEARLKDSESRLEESKLRAARERDKSKELEEELLFYKKKVMEEHENGFNKAIRQAEFFGKDLDLGLFDLFKDVKGCVLLDEEEIVAENEAVDKGQGVTDQGNDACV